MKAEIKKNECDCGDVAHWHGQKKVGVAEERLAAYEHSAKITKAWYDKVARMS